MGEDIQNFQVSKKIDNDVANKNSKFYVCKTIKITVYLFQTHITNYTEIDISFTYNYWNKKDNSGNEEQLIDLKGKQAALPALKSYIKGINQLTKITLASAPIQNFIK